MDSSFQRGRAGRGPHGRPDKAPKTKVSRGNKSPLSGEKYRKSGEEHATARDPQALGAAITTLRLRNGLRQRRLAHEVRIRPGQLSDYELGATTPRPGILKRIAAALGSSVDEIETLADLYSTASQLQDSAEAARAVRLSILLNRAAEAVLPIARPAEPNRREALALRNCLRAYTFPEQKAIVLEGEAFHKFELSVLFCDESLEAAADDAAGAVKLAKLAYLIAALADDAEAPRLRRLQGYAAFHLGNALRVQGNLPRADGEFRRAGELWDQGNDPEGQLAEARVLSMEASLRRSQGRLDEALSLIDRALAADRGGRRAHLLLNRAKILEQMERHEEAIEVLHEAAQRIAGEREPRLLMNQRFNVLVNLTCLGRFSEAERGLPEVRELADRVGKRLNSLRVKWLAGRIHAGLERVAEATAAFEEVRGEFAGRGIATDMALVTLDLTVLCLQQGQTERVKTLAAEMVTVFRAQRVHRETLAAALLFQKAADRERATVELARRLADYLRRAQYQPEVHFEG